MLSGPFSPPRSTGGFSRQDRGAQHVVDGGDVFDLLRESAHALEIALGGSEVEFVVGHGFGGGNNFLLHAGQRAVIHRAKVGF